MNNNASNNSEGKCPFAPASQKHTSQGVHSNSEWWPNQLNLKILHQNLLYYSLYILQNPKT